MKTEREKNETQGEDYCGLSPITTGESDPFYKRGICQRHDAAFQKLKDGDLSGKNFLVNWDFSKDILKGMVEGAYMVLTGPVYLLVGGVLGVLRYTQLEYKKGKYKK